MLIDAMPITGRLLLSHGASSKAPDSMEVRERLSGLLGRSIAASGRQNVVATEPMGAGGRATVLCGRQRRTGPVEETSGNGLRDRENRRRCCRDCWRLGCNIGCPTRGWPKLETADGNEGGCTAPGWRREDGDAVGQWRPNYRFGSSFLCCWFFRFPQTVMLLRQWRSILREVAGKDSMTSEIVFYKPNSAQMNEDGFRKGSAFLVKLQRLEDG
ncbi:hypothetical protein SAY87_002753 [Trapa incisa]|uniref:Uncharacterized protein n=1 Tax=Trapa incisa TaxID=236973 RepID=A0AAN7JX73_9MYRT|nr:hypothetical protein SAY87_002753 [Trapa incisa]